MKTTPQLFGGEPDGQGNPVRPLHTYTIVDAINDHNVLPFRVDYIKTMDEEPDIDDKDVWDIDREKAFLAPERIRLVTQYILDHFDQKTYRNQRYYRMSALTNIAQVASGKQGAVEEIKRAQRISGFNSNPGGGLGGDGKAVLPRVPATDGCRARQAAAGRGHLQLRRQRPGGGRHPGRGKQRGHQRPGADRPGFSGSGIRDYNEIFRTNYSTDGEGFQNYYKDVSLRMKNKELDLLIVVNMFLTGFDATTLNTLWVDKNLKMHGLIQAFSRTNRILNSVKRFGNIVCFRNLQKRVDAAISLFW